MSDVLTGTVDLVDGMRFHSRSGSGHEIVMDTVREYGGTDEGARPLELLLLGLGGCTGMDVISMLRKMRQDVTGYQVRLRADRADDHPRVMTRIEVEHVLTGNNLNPDSVKRAVELSANRYCSAGGMLKQAAPIIERFRIIDAVTGAEITGEIEAAAVPAPAR